MALTFRVETAAEIMSILQHYLGELERASLIAEEIQALLVRTEGPRPIMDIVEGGKVMYRMKPGKIIAIHKVFDALCTSFQTPISGLRETLDFLAPMYFRPTAELREFSRQRFGHRITEAASGNIEGLKRDFWDIDIEPAETVDNVPMIEYAVYGFSEILKARLREMGMYSPEIWSGFLAAQEKIFAPAPMAASKAWDTYVEEHFSSWVARNQ
jgi:hypothetical protein